MSDSEDLPTGVKRQRGPELKKTGVEREVGPSPAKQARREVPSIETKEPLQEEKDRSASPVPDQPLPRARERSPRPRDDPDSISDLEGSYSDAPVSRRLTHRERPALPAPEPPPQPVVVRTSPRVEEVEMAPSPEPVSALPAPAVSPQPVVVSPVPPSVQPASAPGPITGPSIKTPVSNKEQDLQRRMVIKLMQFLLILDQKVKFLKDEERNKLRTIETSVVEPERLARFFYVSLMTLANMLPNASLVNNLIQEGKDRTLRDRVKELEAANKQLERKNERKTRNYNQTRAELKKTEYQLAGAEAQIAELRKQEAELQQLRRSAELKTAGASAEARGRIQQLQESLAASEAQRTELAKGSEALKAIIRANARMYGQQQDEMNTQIQKLKDNLDEIKSAESKDLATCREQLKKCRDDAEEILRRAGPAKLSECKTEIDALNQQIIRLRTDLEAYGNSIRGKNHQIGELEQQLGAEQKALKKAIQEKAEADTKASEPTPTPMAITQEGTMITQEDEDPCADEKKQIATLRATLQEAQRALGTANAEAVKWKNLLDIEREEWRKSQADPAASPVDNTALRDFAVDCYAKLRAVVESLGLQSKGALQRKEPHSNQMRLFEPVASNTGTELQSAVSILTREQQATDLTGNRIWEVGKSVLQKMGQRTNTYLRDGSFTPIEKARLQRPTGQVPFPALRHNILSNDQKAESKRIAALTRPLETSDEKGNRLSNTKVVMDLVDRYRKEAYDLKQALETDPERKIEIRQAAANISSATKTVLDHIKLRLESDQYQRSPNHYQMNNLNLVEAAAALRLYDAEQSMVLYDKNVRATGMDLYLVLITHLSAHGLVPWDQAKIPEVIGRDGAMAAEIDRVEQTRLRLEEANIFVSSGRRDVHIRDTFRIALMTSYYSTDNLLELLSSEFGKDNVDKAIIPPLARIIYNKALWNQHKAYVSRKLVPSLSRFSRFIMNPDLNLRNMDARTNFLLMVNADNEWSKVFADAAGSRGQEFRLGQLQEYLTRVRQQGGGAEAVQVVQEAKRTEQKGREQQENVRLQALVQRMEGYIRQLQEAGASQQRVIQAQQQEGSALLQQQQAQSLRIQVANPAGGSPLEFYYAPFYNVTHEKLISLSTSHGLPPAAKILSQMSYSAMARLDAWVRWQMRGKHHVLTLLTLANSKEVAGQTVKELVPDQTERQGINTMEPRTWRASIEDPGGYEGPAIHAIPFKVNEMEFQYVPQNEAKTYTGIDTLAHMFPQGMITPVMVCADTSSEALDLIGKFIKTMYGAVVWLNQPESGYRVRFVVVNRRGGFIPMWTSSELLRAALRQNQVNVKGVDRVISTQMEVGGLATVWRTLGTLVYWCRMISMSPNPNIGAEFSSAQMKNALEMVKQKVMFNLPQAQRKDFALDESEQKMSFPVQKVPDPQIPPLE